MFCWSCQKEIPEAAKYCPHCEAEVEKEPTAEERAAIENAMAGMSPELIDELRDTFEKSATGEDFVNRIMIGDCPKCGSSNTGDCENDPEVEDLCVGRCFDCGQLWCPDCGECFNNAAQSTDHDCPAWDDMDFDDEDLGD
ncbi:MAG: hypothetical protein ACC645_12890 [Pirellulales bacterium]